MASQSQVLPTELEREILLRLPSNSLFRFTTVCKTWHNMITQDPSFTTSYNHFHSTLSPQPFLLLSHPLDFFTYSPSPLFSLSTTILESPEKAIYFDTKSVVSRVEIVNQTPINGVLCMILHVGILNYELVLWNVSSGERLDCPTSSLTGLFCEVPPTVRFCTMFGYDRIKDDYKVFRAVYLDSQIPICEIFSLREFSWRKVEGLPLSGILSNTLWAGSCGTFLDGVGYWGGYKTGWKDGFFLLGYDFESDCLSEVDVPGVCVDGEEMRFHSLWVHKGLLAISVLRFGDFESSVTQLCVWGRMAEAGVEEMNWVKLFNIDLEGGPRRPVVSLVSGEIVLLGDGGGDHLLYDPQNGEVKSLDVYDVDAVVPYVESLVCLKKMLPVDS